MMPNFVPLSTGKEIASHANQSLPINGNYNTQNLFKTNATIYKNHFNIQESNNMNEHYDHNG